MFKSKQLTFTLVKKKKKNFSTYTVALSVLHHLEILFSVLQLISPSESLADGSKGSSIRRKHQDGSGHGDSTHSIPSTPDRYCPALDWSLDDYTHD